MYVWADTYGVELLLNDIVDAIHEWSTSKRPKWSPEPYHFEILVVEELLHSKLAHLLLRTLVDNVFAVGYDELIRRFPGIAEIWKCDAAVVDRIAALMGAKVRPKQIRRLRRRDFCGEFHEHKKTLEVCLN